MKKKQKVSKKKAGIGKKVKNNVFIPKLRERLRISILDEEHVLGQSSKIPNCIHGPCLLFSDSANNRWFGCAVFRSPKLCKFRLKLDQNGKFNEFEHSNKLIYTRPIDEYGKASKSFDTFIEDGIDPYWCQQCSDFKQKSHKHNQLIGPISKWPNPLNLLDKIEEDNGMAQYLFTNETISIVEDALAKEQIDSFLCIGTPSLFEKFKMAGKNSFLLDFDDRLSLFYHPSEFARFSMLVCHFYLAESQKYFHQFLQRSRRLICLCDPPFGIQISALIRTIQRLKHCFFGEEMRQKEGKSFNTILFVPYFIGKHLPKECSLSMVDYNVTYSNHREYCRAQKSIVRMFTDLANISFELPAKMGYHFCSKCNRFVAKENQHCWKCGECTSKDGTSFVHCERCGRCVRRKYKHCKNCSYCHLPERCLKNN